MGAVGHDETAKIILKQLQDEKISYSIFEAEDGVSTGLCAVTVNNVDRTCIAILDACEKYPTSHMANILTQAAVMQAHVFYSTAFFISSNLQALKLMAETACKMDKLFAFNLASEDVTAREKVNICEMLELTDIIFCNKNEALDFSRKMSTELNIDGAPEDELKISDISAELARISEALVLYKKKNTQRGRIAIITNSAQPVVVAFRNGDVVSSFDVPVE